MMTTVFKTTSDMIGKMINRIVRMDEEKKDLIIGGIIVTGFMVEVYMLIWFVAIVNT